MRQIKIKVTSRAKRPHIEPPSGSDFYRVFVSSPAHDGLANRAVVKILADWFGVSSRAVRIRRGHKSRDKIIEISDRQV